MNTKVVVPFFSLVIALIAVGAFLLSFNQASTFQSSNKVRVAAAENFWGSLATQLGGDRVVVTSIVTDPNADPHEYESSTTNARALAQADYVVYNGAGYDDWVVKLLGANPSSARKVLSVADLVGKKPGDNPHFWYSPTYVKSVVDQITADYQTLSPVDAAYFSLQRATVLHSLQSYFDQIESIKAKYSGTNVAATEDIVRYLADATDLRLISPADFMSAVAEGNDPSTASTIAFEQQLAAGQVRVLLYNKQTSTAVTTNIKKIAADYRIPTVGVTEIVDPATSTFQDWMTNQLTALSSALASIKQ